MNTMSAPTFTDIYNSLVTEKVDEATDCPLGALAAYIEEFCAAELINGYHPADLAEPIASTCWLGLMTEAAFVLNDMPGDPLGCLDEMRGDDWEAWYADELDKRGHFAEFYGETFFVPEV